MVYFVLVSLCQLQSLVLKIWHYTCLVITEEFYCGLMTVSLATKTLDICKSILHINYSLLGGKFYAH